MHHTLNGAVHAPVWLPVQALSDIEFRVKESEVLTGEAGRCVVIAGTDCLTYRVQWHPLGFRVERLDGLGRVLDHRVNLGKYPLLHGRSFEVTVGVGGHSGYVVDLRTPAAAAIVTDGGNHAER